MLPHFCRANIRQKIFQLLMIYDDELRNPRDFAQKSWQRIEDWDYDKILLDDKSKAVLAHLVPQVRQMLQHN